MFLLLVIKFFTHPLNFFTFYSLASYTFLQSTFHTINIPSIKHLLIYIYLQNFHMYLYVIVKRYAIDVVCAGPRQQHLFRQQIFCGNGKLIWSVKENENIKCVKIRWAIYSFHIHRPILPLLSKIDVMFIRCTSY